MKENHERVALLEKLLSEKEMTVSTLSNAKEDLQVCEKRTFPFAIEIVMGDDRRREYSFSSSFFSMLFTFLIIIITTKGKYSNNSTKSI
jgi:hypothetical protein